MGNMQPVQCHHECGSIAGRFPRAFPEKHKKAPLDPKQDEQDGTKAYEWGFEAIPMSQTHGQRSFDEVQDALNHQVPKKSFPTDARAFHAMKPSEDRINQQYDHMLGDELNKSGPGAARFGTGYQRLLSYHHGLYVPERHQAAKPADDVRIAVSEFADKVEQDDPSNACKYLQIEEMRCLQAHQFETNPKAASRCVKWFDEVQKCQWDQYKFNQGITHMEGPQMRRRRPYIFYPDFKKA